MNLTNTISTIKKVFEHQKTFGIKPNVIFVSTTPGLGTINELKQLSDNCILFRTNQLTEDGEAKRLIKEYSDCDLMIFEEFEKASISTIDDITFEFCEGNLVGKNVIIVGDLDNVYPLLDDVIINKLMIFNVELDMEEEMFKDMEENYKKN